jgi:hypothetical protein
MAEPRARVDWDAIEPHYRAGVRSLRDIAEEFGVSNPAIVKHAEKCGWTRNLEAKIKEKADAKVAAALVASERAESPAVKLTEAIRVEVEAEIQSRIRISHQKTLTKLREQAEDLLVESTASGDDLKTRISSLKALTETVAKLVPLERQAYGVDTEVTDPTDTGVLDPIEGAKRLAFILARAGQHIQQQGK